MRIATVLLASVLENIYSLISVMCMYHHFAYYTCSQMNALHTILSKNANFSMNVLTEGSCTACFEKNFVTFTFVILVVGITLGKNLPQF